MSGKEWVKTDRVNEVIKAIGALTKMDVLVGVPESETERESQDEPNNATLAYIHEHGSPARNIPARPFLVPGVADAKGKYRQRLIKAAQLALDGKTKDALKQLEAAGILAEQGAKKKIQIGPFEPLQPETIANRHKTRKTKSMRKSEIKYLKKLKEGSSPEEAQNAVGIKPLINTGQLRNSITHVVREKK